MTHGNVDRFYITTSAYSHTEHLSTLSQGSGATNSFSQGAMFPNQGGLGTTKGGHIKHNPKVAGQTKPARMSQAMPINQKNIRELGKLCHGS